ncbi:alkylated DNA repair protein alkB homolog 8 isoform X3 [Hylaeus anthracinus]|uniref:alkylated DNA repair protein alkB homolog 8 isoform X3 n=1 Tax=Hylaeus anthracinus TaxID=313031 RepID=UPI0023B99C06|nr:alkylated DNA repair protein alkB homolog 8 isoform X3 [Hylaeus anthracinus]
MEEKLIKKSNRKQKRAYHRLLKDMNIKCCDNVTKNVMICNGGLVTGLQRETLQSIIDPLISKYDLVMIPNKSYCFIKCYSSKDAEHIYNQIHGCVKLKEQSTPLYASFTESVPNIDYHQLSSDLPSGLRLIENIITKEEEEALLKSINWSDEGEARYAWSHGICPRHNDVVETVNGITTQPRGTRVSFTFRKVRSGDCYCTFPEYCDTKKTCTDTLIDNKVATGIENSYVHEVYEKISSHFDETRHKQWPNVSKFLQSLSPGDILLDVGCGNGKYLHEQKHIFKIGCDRSQNLMKICHSKNFEVFLSDCLYLPYKSNSLDAAISIAVIHHLSTHERRKQAISELARVLKPNGKCLIYVWAKEQEKDSTRSAYLKYNITTKENEPACKQKLTEYGVTLPVHENRTKFVSTDMLVPWKRKGGGDFLRYYHVFEENELAQLCSEVFAFTIKNTYYDQGNWCVLLQKK